MPKKVLNGNDIKYSLVYIGENYIPNLKTLEKRRHDIIGYGSMIDNHYTFYSIEDNYSHAIVNHWTEHIVKDYDIHNYWILIKTHPCNLYTIMVDIYESSSYICELNNFDIWETEAKNCLIAVITDIVIG